MGHLIVTCGGCLKELMNETWESPKTEEELQETFRESAHKLTDHSLMCSNPTSVIPYNFRMKA